MRCNSILLCFVQSVFLSMWLINSHAALAQSIASPLQDASADYESALANPDRADLLELALLSAAVAADALPEDSRPHILIGSLYLRLSENALALQEAEAAFLTALDLAPGDVRATTLLGQVYFLQRRFYSARTSWLPLLIAEADGLGSTLLSQTLQAYLLNDDVLLGLQELNELRLQYRDNPWLAALEAGLLKARLRVVNDADAESRLQRVRNWWQQQTGAPAELAAFVDENWLGEG